MPSNSTRYGPLWLISSLGIDVIDPVSEREYGETRGEEYPGADVQVHGVHDTLLAESLGFLSFAIRESVNG